MKVANSICYQLMLQPNGSDLITSKLIDDINNAAKVCNCTCTQAHAHTQMHFIACNNNYLTGHGAIYAVTNGKIPCNI